MARALGLAGEAAAAAWYEAQGYEVVARNWRVREGEIDLIVRRDTTYVFCEVKARSSHAFGAPIEAVGRQKQVRIRRLAARWLTERDPASGRVHEIRFDVASVMGGNVEVAEGCF